MKNTRKSILSGAVSTFAAAVLLMFAGQASVGEAGDVVQVAHSAFGYIAGTQQVIECSITYPTGRLLQSLLWTPGLPTGWTLVRSEGATTGDGSPEIDSDGAIIFMARSFTNNPIVFRYTVQVPPREIGERTLYGTVEYQLDGMRNPATTNPTALVLADAYAAHTALGYLAGTPLTVNCTFSLPLGARTKSLLWQPELPSGWRLTSASGDGAPEASADGESVVFLGSLLTNRISFSYTVAVPTNAINTQNVGGFAEYELAGMANPVAVRARPDPLVVRPMHTLQIVSTYGTGQLPVGTYTNFYGTTLTNLVNGSVVAGSRTFACTGWTLTGNEPVIGSSTNCVLTLTNNATLTWVWVAPLVSPATPVSVTMDEDNDANDVWEQPAISAITTSDPVGRPAGVLTWHLKTGGGAGPRFCDSHRHGRDTDDQLRSQSELERF